jgi:hypothetical protein
MDYAWRVTGEYYGLLPPNDLYPHWYEGPCVTMELLPVACPMIAKLDAWSAARRPREVGRYWCSIENREWQLWFWDGGDQRFSEDGLFWYGGAKHPESYFEDIHPRRIPTPDE